MQFIFFNFILLILLSLPTPGLTYQEISPGTRFGGMQQETNPLPNPIVRERKQEPGQEIKINISPDNSANAGTSQNEKPVPKKVHRTPKIITVK